ncbi:hypothetical protein C440_02558 [Haloferax mucosum ATCC BAA-1512]|uniref:DUF7343 domain-containing protein n=1 Tax=Haloferax mucosum ATCC BAA-1512 TaxID=662479 RepID=M0IQJ8_9EURY|nr:hypothetical protein [Haloferax mucosum]ELZ98093.1 hypothetical protein C440_02558 [Haloferax mucosum ATCC BAA-1512]
MSNRSNKDTRPSTPSLVRTGVESGIVNYRRTVLYPLLAYCKRVFGDLAASIRRRLGQGVAGASAIDLSARGTVGDTLTNTDTTTTHLDDDPSHSKQRSESDGSGIENTLPDVDPELLDPERRIFQLLIIEGGRLSQATLVERTRWSDSTISRTLCQMESQGRIDRYRLGTGKCVVLPQRREK